MASLYGLKTQPAITKTLISIWGADPSGRRLNALLVALARDPLLRDTASVIANAMVGSQVQRLQTEAALQWRSPWSDERKNDSIARAKLQRHLDPKRASVRTR